MKTEKPELTFAIGEHLPRVMSISRSYFDPMWAEIEHTSVNAELIHFLSGSGEVKTRDYTICAKEGDTIYIPKNTPHLDVFAQNPTVEIYFVQFTWEDSNHLLKLFNPTQLTNISERGRHRINQEFKSLFKDFMAQAPFGYELACINIFRIIALLCREAGTSAGIEDIMTDDLSKPRRVQIMMLVKRILHEKYNQPISLNQIADMLNISSYYVSHVFSTESGFRLSSYLTEIRMEKAVEMLDNPQLNISEIALAVGFMDSHYFGQVFKAHFGVSPKIYRAKLLLDKNKE
jgi:AraC-like DNA-binding protein/quercetin dioxygenase-like cupin family protein